MTEQMILNADQFIDCRHDLPDGGRWHELHSGVPTMLEPPDDDHGNAVLNLSRALAEWFQMTEAEKVGYACPSIGIKVSSDPDTVYFPALSFFNQGRQYEQSDYSVATQTPSLIVDIASSNDRRREMRTRTLDYAELGVMTLWVPDPMKKELTVIQDGHHTTSLGEWQMLDGGDTLPGFRMKVADIYQQPDWWK